MSAKLLLVRGQPQGKSLIFPSGEYVIGRGDECHVRPNSSWVSRQHCILRVGDDCVSLKDLGSTNGTLVNGTRIRGELTLAEGDHVQIGPLVFKLLLPEPVHDDTSYRDTAVQSCLSTFETPVLSAQTLPDMPVTNPASASQR
jgi:pSer/pThr/pTyr-binding forkhead associated (FHA) protein